MKTFALATLFAMACAEPEAKPWLTYGYAGAYAPTVYGAGVYGHAYPYATAYHYGKREAEADAEAKPWLAYGYNYGYNYAAAPYAGVYGAYPYATAYHYGKREAEAEADPALLYSAGYAGYPYAGVYSGYNGVYGAYRPAYYSGYRGYAIGKREAEAEPEADPALLYSAGYTGYPYATTAYAGYPFAHSAFSAYPYATTAYHYGKREAEAEPQYYAGRYYGGYRAYRPYAYGYGRRYFY